MVYHLQSNDYLLVPFNDAVETNKIHPKYDTYLAFS